MSKSEKQIENEIKGYLDELGAYHIKTLGGSVPAGTPDILACIEGRFVAIEVKKEIGGIVSELQKFKIREVRKAGGLAFVARSVNDVERELNYV